jgi:hypothetical protein
MDLQYQATAWPFRALASGFVDFQCLDRICPFCLREMVLGIAFARPYPRRVRDP